MKLSKTSWLILTIGIFVITLGSLGVTHSQRLNEGKKLSDELAVAKVRLSKLELKDLYDQQANLETQVKQTEAQIEADQARLTQLNDSISISDSVFTIAEASGVQIAQVSSGALIRSDVEKVSTTMLPFEATVLGGVPNLIDFIYRLNSDFPTGEVKLGEIMVTSSSNNISGNTTAASGPTAHVQIVIHSYSQGK